jgi:uncharacterized protein (TIGR02147 family)
LVRIRKFREDARILEPPRIFDYLDYRAFLEAHFDHRKRRDPEFSLRVFARHPELKLSSSSFLSAVLKGRKNLSQNLRLRFGRALGLQAAELEYFELLIQSNQSRSADERAHFQSQLARFHASRARVLADAQHRFYAHWYIAVVWHWFGLHPDQSNPARIAKSIHPPLEPAQVEEAIRVLLELKLIKKLANGYAVTERHLAAGPAFRGTAAREHGRAFLRLALDNLERVPAAERDYHVLSFPLAPRGRERLRGRLDALRAELRELAEQGGEGEGARVYALAVQLFPCSDDGAGGEGRPARAGHRAGTSSDTGNPAD